VCWVAFSESDNAATTTSWNLFAYRSNGTILHSLSGTSDGVITSISPVSGDQVWITVGTKASGTAHEEIRLVDFNSVSTAVTTTLSYSIDGRLVNGHLTF